MFSSLSTRTKVLAVFAFLSAIAQAQIQPNQINNFVNGSNNANTVNLNSAMPHADNGWQNVKFRYDSAGNVSAEMPAPGTEFTPTNFVFTGPTATTVVNLQPSSFIITADPLTSASTFTTYSPSSPGTVTVSAGVATIAGTGATDTVIAQTVSSFTLPNAFVSTTVSHNGTDSSTSDYAGVGIAENANNFVIGEVDRIRNYALIHIRIGGTDTITHVSFTPPSAPYTIGFSLVGNDASLYVNSGSGWVWEISALTTSEYDFRTAGNLSGWHGAIEAGSGGSGTTWEFSAPLNIGYFGGVGLSDIYAVITPDGSPYINQNLAYFTASCPDGQGYASSTWMLYMCTFSYNMQSGAVTPLGGVFFTRGGKNYNDVSGNMVFSEATGTYYVVATQLSSSPIALELATTTTNLLSGFNAVTATTLTLPGTSGSVGAEDGSLVYNGTTALWNLSFSLVPAGSGTFYPALASSSNLTSWSSIGTDSASTGYEESRVTLNNGNLYFMWGGPYGTGNTVRVYNSAMSYQGALNATIGPTSIMDPGATVFGFGNTEYLFYWNQTGFNSNNFTWGPLVVQTAPRYPVTNVTSINAASPLTANGVSGTAENGVVTIACTGCSGGGGSTVTPAPPYIEVGTTFYDSDGYAVTKPPSSPSWVNSVTPATVTTGTNGNLILGASNTTVYFQEETGSTSSEVTGRIFTSGGTAIMGPWVWDSTNNLIWTLNVYFSSSTGNAVGLQWNKYGYSGSGNPSFSASSSAAFGANLVGSRVHLQLKKVSSTLDFNISLDGGATYQTIYTQSVGTISDGGMVFYAGGGNTVVSVESVKVQ